jgi:hypothetical protein
MLTEKQQFILKVSGFLAITGLMGLFLYFLFFNQGPDIVPTTDTPTDQTPGTNTGLPQADTGTPGTGTTPGDDNQSGSLPVSPVANGGVTKTTQLTNARIISPTPTPNGDLAYYDPRDGKFYTIDDGGNVVTLSQQQFPAAESVTFSDQADQAVIEFPDGSNIVYNFSQGKQVTLPAHWEDFSFSKDGNSLATKSVGNDPSNRSLVITSADGSSAQSIAALGDNQDRVDVNWSPDGDIVGFSKTGGGGSAFGQNEVYLIGTDGEASGVLIVNGSNFKNLWSPNGANLLYSVADAGDEYRASLWYGDALGDRRGDTRMRLSLKTTANKCTFASDTLAYCAVPLEMPAGGGSAPSLIKSGDLLYSVSFPSGRSNLVAIPEKETEMSDLHVTPDGNQLYYTDTFGRLNVMQLK